MGERSYGEFKTLYRVVERQDGRIELHVCHTNKEMRQVLQKHIGDPRQLLRHHSAYSRSSIRAKYWLAKVMSDYRSQFLQNLVKIMMNPGLPHRTMAAPPANAPLEDARQQRGSRTGTLVKPREITPEHACEVIHATLEELPPLASPRDVPFGDGLYFFYEQGEVSDHAPSGRIVRVGNHPRSQGGLVRRLRLHYSGNKNSSVFRKFLGGALMRKEDPSNPCLSPAPGKGHWERQDEKTCPRCKPTEALVTDLLRNRFRFRCVKVPDLAERNGLEALLIATLAACSVCRPSRSWLGLHAYSEVVQASGLWNSQYVGERYVFGSDGLERLATLIDRTLHPSVQ